jgi:hypothetical protein
MGIPADREGRLATRPGGSHRLRLTSGFRPIPAVRMPTGEGVKSTLSGRSFPVTSTVRMPQNRPCQVCETARPVEAMRAKWLEHRRRALFGQRTPSGDANPASPNLIGQWRSSRLIMIDGIATISLFFVQKGESGFLTAVNQLGYLATV